MSHDEFMDLMESLWMCDAVSFNPVGMTNRDIAEAYWKVREMVEQRKWSFNLKYRYN